MNPLMSRQALLSIISSGVLAACGTEAQVSMAPQTEFEAELSSDGEQVNAQVKVIEGEFQEQGSTTECLALRGKIFKDRQTLKLSSAWRNVTSTPEYKALDEDKAHLAGAGCTRPSTTPPAACAQLANKVLADSAALAKTPQWSVLVQGNQFKDLMDDWNKALQISCVH